MKEIEIKARIPNLPVLRRKLGSLGAVATEIEHQVDTYYTAPHRNFLKTLECLRVRHTNDGTTVTYKPQSTERMKDAYWKKEVNLNVHNKDAAHELLRCLDFKPVVTVEKRRENYTLGRGVNIGIDKLKLGRGHRYFIEVESITDESEEKVLPRLNEILNSLGIDRRYVEARPYRDIVLAHLG